MKKAGWDTCLTFSLTTLGQIGVFNLLAEYIIRWPNGSLKNWLLQTLSYFAPGFSRAVEYNLLNLILSMKTVSQRLQLLHFFPQDKSLQSRLCSPLFLVAVQSTSAAATAAFGTHLWHWAHPWPLQSQDMSLSQQHHPLHMHEQKILSYRFSDEAYQPRPASLKNTPSLLDLSFPEEYLKQQQQRKRKGKITSFTF